MSMGQRARAAALIVAVLGTGVALAAWKQSSIEDTNAAAAHQPEPTESVAFAIAEQREHSQTTTSIGTVVALRSITVRNELPGTVRHVKLTPGDMVAAGTVLVGLDVSVERPNCRRWRRSATWRKPSSHACSAWWSGKAASADGAGRRARAARHRRGADRAHPGRDRAQDHPRAVPRARRHLRRARGPVPQRRHGAHHASGRGRSHLRRFHGGAAGRPRRCARACTVRMCITDARWQTPIAAQASGAGFARVDRAHAQHHGSCTHRGCSPAPSPGASVRVEVPVGAPRRKSW